MSDECAGIENVSNAEEVLLSSYLDVVRNGVGLAERGVTGVERIHLDRVRNLDGVFLRQLVELRRRVVTLEHLVAELVAVTLEQDGRRKDRVQ
jgi:hypothetical protein